MLPAGSFWIISRSKPFVKNFFKFFRTYLTGFSPCRPRGQLGQFSTDAFICQELFYKFFQISSSFTFQPPLPRTACIYYHMPDSLSSIIHKIRPLFSYDLTTTGGASFEAPLPLFLIQYRQSSHNHRRCVYKQPRRFRRCPHPGRQRSCDPAGSSASPLPHGSLA